jgi:hypothetical protein
VKSNFWPSLSAFVLQPLAALFHRSGAGFQFRQPFEQVWIINCTYKSKGDFVMPNYNFAIQSCIPQKCVDRVYLPDRSSQFAAGGEVEIASVV